MIEEKPLLLFSIYTLGQVEYLVSLGIELVEEMNSWNNGAISDFNNTYYRYWLWVLGSYEVMRTMDENNECFVESMRRAIKQLKVHLADIRIPFAKQELRGKKQKVYAELSVKSVNQDMFFDIKGQEFSAKESITKFNSFIESIKVTDVIKRYS